MKNFQSFLLLTVILILTACKGKNNTADEAVQKPKVPVEITTVGYGFVSDNLELSASTVYLSRNMVMAPIPSYITKVFVKIGDRVHRGQLLYQLETKERRALGNTPVHYDSSLAGYGTISVRAPSSGVISAIDRQQAGDYVLEGAPLCTIAQTGGMAFQVNVPFEFIRYTTPGIRCTIVLPNDTRHPAVFIKPLTSMNVPAQTQTILAQATDNLILPEGLIAKVLVNKGSGNNSQVLPKAAVLSDEMMHQFWVMKLINDSTAIKVPVFIGNKNQEDVEIRSPQFSSSDKILTNGNYGLPDTALVKVIQK